jgi:hypothetical protein
MRAMKQQARCRGPRATAPWLLTLTLTWVALIPWPASANGNVSHIRATLWAVDQLPQGELRELLERDDLDVMLQNGANFPDGGYAVNDGYGEIAHWEPFQSAYLDWIAESFEPPWTDEAAGHIAFLMGMASHGMCDQLYDSMYLRRGGVHDEGSPGSNIGMDGSTDVCLAAEAGGLEPPEFWVPDALMAELMVDEMGHAVDASTIADGQALVAFSVYFVSEVSEDPVQVAEHREAYPWSCDHQMDLAVPGSAQVAAAAIAVYWQRLWDRLAGGDPLEKPLMAAYPVADQTGHRIDPEDIESMVSFVVSRGLDADSATGDSIVVTDADGAERAADIHVYYGHHSHVVNLHPVEGWAEAGPHTVAVEGLRAWDGGEHAPFSFQFTTADFETDPPDNDCSCQANGGRGGVGYALVAWVLLSARRGWRRRGRRSAGPETL